MSEEPLPAPSSPPWSSNTKLVVALTLVVIAGALLVNFQFIINPLLISLLLAYLLHPVANLLQKQLRMPWGAAVSVVYLLLVLILLGLLAWGGFSLAQQGQSVLLILKDGVERLPQLIEEYANRQYDLYFTQFSPKELNLDFNLISEQAPKMIEPLLSQTGALLSSIAGGAADFFGWTLFVLFVSYFIVAESGGGSRSKIVALEIPGYSYDAARLTRELSRIWNAFLRGQISIFLMTIVIYVFVLEALGVKYAITLAFIAGLARFLPYVGPAINWVVLALIAYFQEYQIFNLSPLAYVTLVLVVTIVVDMTIDYVVTPRIYSDTLQVHPAAVLVAAIVAATLFGLLGVVVSAPILASAILLWKYVMNKMLNRNPWQEDEQRQALSSPADRLRDFLSKINLKFKRRG